MTAEKRIFCVRHMVEIASKSVYFCRTSVLHRGNEVPTITVRCTEAQKIELEDRAAGDLSAYVRRQLFEKIEYEKTLQTILSRLEDQPGKAGASGHTDSPLVLAMLMELVLLLRTASKPEAKKEAWAEVERLGFTVWESAGAKP